MKNQKEMVMGVKEGLMERGVKIKIKKEGIISSLLKVGKKKQRAIRMYINEDMEKKLIQLKQIKEKEERMKITIDNKERFYRETGMQWGLM